MLKNKGFSLLELVIVVLISVVVFVGFFTLIGHFKIWSANLALLLERDSNLWITPLLLSRWVLHAGNNRSDQSWQGISAHGNRLQVNSDIDGPEGFPDGELDSSFEVLELRQSGANLQIKSKTGTFQPAAKNIRTFLVDTDSVPSLSIRLRAITDRPLQADTNREESIDLLFLLRNYRPNLFGVSP